MSSWWQTTKKILSGKAKGSKLIILGVFLVGTGVVLEVSLHTTGSLIFVVLGVMAFTRGLSIYTKEARAELEKKANNTIGRKKS